MSPRSISLILNIAIPAAIATMLAGTMGLPWPILWLFFVNIWLIVIMGKDKFTARVNHKQGWGWRRTPESTLLALTLLGATPAMFLGRFVFNHKSSKQPFTQALFGVCAAQTVLIFLFRNEVMAWLRG